MQDWELDAVDDLYVEQSVDVDELFSPDGLIHVTGALATCWSGWRAANRRRPPQTRQKRLIQAVVRVTTSRTSRPTTLAF